MNLPFGDEVRTPFVTLNTQKEKESHGKGVCQACYLARAISNKSKGKG